MTLSSFLSNPVQSFLELNLVLQQFVSISGCKINEYKYELLDFSLALSIRLFFGSINKAYWVDNVKNLGIQLGKLLDPKKLLEENVSLLINETRVKLDKWRKFTILWFGCIATLKIKVLPRFLFVAQCLITPIPYKVLQEIQSIQQTHLGR